MPVSKAQQRATAKYVKANYDRMEIVVPKGTRETIKKHAAAHGESIGAFIKRAVDYQMNRDISGSPTEAAGSPSEAGGITLPPSTLKAAQEEAEAAGEAVPVFMARAVETQAQRDKLARGMKK